MFHEYGMLFFMQMFQLHTDENRGHQSLLIRAADVLFQYILALITKSSVGSILKSLKRLLYKTI